MVYRLHVLLYICSLHYHRVPEWLTQNWVSVCRLRHNPIECFLRLIDDGSIFYYKALIDSMYDGAQVMSWGGGCSIFLKYKNEGEQKKTHK